MPTEKWLTEKWLTRFAWALVTALFIALLFTSFLLWTVFKDQP